MHKLHLAFAALLALPLLAQPAPTAHAGPGDTSAALARALDVVRTSDLSADLHFIASDELGGRDTPSEGLKIAARFIRARLQRLGFEPGAEQGYFHYYPLELRQLDAEGTRASVQSAGAERELAFGSDYYFSSREIADATLSGKLVFVGSGNDLGGVDVAGRWLVSWDEGGSTRRRRRTAQQAGAAGLILTPGPAYEGKPFSERYGSYSERALKPSVSRARRSEGVDDTEGALEFSSIYLTRAAAEGLVPAGCAPGTELEATWSETRKRAGDGAGSVQMENVAGFWRGSDPQLASEVIIISAHYDHVGTRGGNVYNGADDNGSGTCGLLAVAEALEAYGPMRRSVLLLWVSGEEKGLWGSAAWTEDPWLPEGCKPVCNVNIDMIGRNAPDKLLITPTAEHAAYNGLSRKASELAPLEGFPKLGSADDYWRRSDHMNFNDNLKIPVAFLFSDVHEDYHQHTDTAEKIDYDKMQRVVRLVVRLLDALQADELLR